ncbi:MAG: glycosyltransferase [Bacteroidetes bacterium]|jgi:glycosyltransferase involved in cell wall biosynthesis|nr:glycosyltransferase [Bacteroidota bacterium]
MRIGLIIYGAINQQTGGYLYDRKLVETLQRDGHTVRLFSLPAGSYPAHLADNFRLRFARCVAAADLDILLEDELNHPSLFLLNHVLRATCRCPIISIVHHLRASEQHPAIAHWIYRVVERQYLQSVDGFIFNSHATKEAVYALAPCMQQAPHTVAWPGRPDLTEDRLRLTEPQDGEPEETKRLTLLFVGSVIKRKGLRELAAALHDVPAEGWTLHVAGDDTVDPVYTNECQQALREVPGEVRWHGFVDDEQLQRLYAAADVLVVPSFHEGFGIVYLEAMGYGVPVIAASKGGASDFVRAGYNGFLVDPTDRSRMAQQITQLRQPDTRKQMGKAAAATFEDHPTWDDSMRTAANLIYMYQ